MGRKKKLGECLGLGGVPICQTCNGPLSRQTAPSSEVYECDGCQGEIPPGGVFFGCQKKALGLQLASLLTAPLLPGMELPGMGQTKGCDYSLCGTCYVNHASEATEAAEKAKKYEKYIVPEGQIHPEIYGLCEGYDIEEKVIRLLNEEMRNRFETWEMDLKKLEINLRHSKGKRSSILWICIRHMKEGIWYPWEPPRPEIQRVIKQYNLDQDAHEKLTDYLQKKERAGEDWQKDLWETEQRLMGAWNPSMTALTMVVKLQQGKELPPIKPIRKNDTRRNDEKDNRRSRSRSRGERRQREASVQRDRGEKRRDSRDPGRGDDRRDRYRYHDRGRDDQGGRDDRGRGGRDDRGRGADRDQWDDRDRGGNRRGRDEGGYDRDRGDDRNQRDDRDRDRPARDERGRDDRGYYSYDSWGGSK